MKPKKPQRRRWTATIATPVPVGPEGQPPHAVGASIVVIDLVEVPGIGNVSIPVPSSSSLLLTPALVHMKRAERLREQAKKQTGRNKWIQLGHERSFTNEELVFDFFGEAMSGVILSFAALDNLLNEMLPSNFEYKTGDEVWDRRRIESSAGIERKLTQIVPSATGRASLADANPELFSTIVELKQLRDDIGHAKLDRGYGGIDRRRTIFSDLFSTNLIEFVDAVLEVGSHFRDQ